jgi:hypothetical protein
MGINPFDENNKIIHAKIITANSIEILIKMKFFLPVLFSIQVFLISSSVFAQDQVRSGPPAYHIAVFAPVYLDSVFTGNYYHAGKKFPRFIVPGLDFFQGAEIALDSLPLPNATIIAHFFDTKSETGSIEKLIMEGKLDSMQLIIGSVRDEDFSGLAGFAKRKSIPFISATYPNDGGITANPYLVIVNSTLKSHCESIFSFLLQNHGTDNIVHVRKKGSQEDRVAGYFNTVNRTDGGNLLKIKTLNLDSNFNLLKNSLDSNQQNIIVAGSLDEDFARSICQAASSLKKKYRITLIGMPNWDGFTSLSAKELKDFPIHYTSAYFNNKWDDKSKMIQDLYLKKYKGKPSDYAFKGFEMIHVFSQLLSSYPVSMMAHLNDYAYNVFCAYNFKAVYLSKDKSIPDYYENKHVYFLKKLNGVVSKAW